ncbi:unnamed protein product [Urochloa humidicola]
MEFSFFDGAIVRLRSHKYGTYIHADEDWRRVALRPECALLKAVWLVQRLQRGGTNHALLRSAAYGRYLAMEYEDGVGQRDYDEDDVLWEVFNAGGWEWEGYVFIRQSRQPRGYLCVNDGDPTRSKYWAVDSLLPRLDRPVLPRPVVEQPVVLRRHIFFVLGDNLGRFQNVWRVIEFDGRSVYNLRRKLARNLKGAGLLNSANSRDITLCIKADSQARLTHLSIDLPAKDFIEIVVLRTDSTADWMLPHPDLDSVQEMREQDDWDWE